ncbi:hypothetical protein ACP70R_006259 [Stipagrostis hirtigluma subsp. patula]
MRHISLWCSFLVCVAALQANASQEARLREFILSRRSSGSCASNVHEPSFSVKGSLRAEYSVSGQGALKAADKIAALPGQPDGVSFNQYGGYVTVDEKNGRALFYYFVEATHDAAAKPLLLWLNGGPGCSSLGYGAMIELGPFRINSDNKTLSRNENAWNTEANVLFLESPAGVGFSYSNTSSDYNKSGDQRTTDDAYVFLINWLERFPEYKGRAFYISGESYAGHHAPQLAATILSHNIESKRTIINLQAILVGNPYLDDYKNKKGKIDYLWSHGVISDEVWANINKNCKFSPSDGKVCDDAMAAYDSGYISGDNIYSPVCIIESDGTYFSSSNGPGIDPCSDHYIHAYLNNPMVQKAFHARSTKWTGCTLGLDRCSIVDDADHQMAARARATGVAVQGTPSMTLASLYLNHGARGRPTKRLEAMFSNTKEVLCLLRSGELAIKFLTSSLREH